MRDLLQKLDEDFAFQTSVRFDLLASEHVPYLELGADDIDGKLRRSIERAEGVTTVVGRIGSGKSSLIASVTDRLDETFVPLRVSVIGVEVGDPAAFARHAILEVRDLPETQLTRHERTALDRATAETRTRGTVREVRAGLGLQAGTVLSANVVADIKQSASDQLTRAADPGEALRGIQRLLDTFWKVKRCPVLIVEDTDHWGGSPDIADTFFDHTARALAGMDVAVVVPAQRDYTALDGYARMRDKLTDEVVLPKPPDVEDALARILQRRIASTGTSAELDDVLEAEGLQLLSESYMESVQDEHAGDLRRTIAVMRAGVDIALAESTAELVTRGHIQEAVAKTPLAPPSAL